MPANGRWDLIRRLKVKLNSNLAAVETWNLKGRTAKLRVFVNKMLMWKFEHEVI